MTMQRPILLEVEEDLRPELAWARLGSKPQGFCLDAGKRYTFMGFAPALTFASQGGFITTTSRSGKTRTQIDNPVDALNRFAEKLNQLPIDQYLPFYGGLVGFVSFEWGASQHCNPLLDNALPGQHDAWFGLYDAVLVFDNIEKTAYVAALGLNDEAIPDQQRAEVQANELLRAVLDPDRSDDDAFAPANHRFIDLQDDSLAPVSPMRRYRDVARNIQHKLWKGDAQKVNMAQRYVGLIQDEPWAVHANLRAENPTPHSMFINVGPYQLCSTSPTCLMTLDNRLVKATPVIATQGRVGTNYPTAKEILADNPSATGLLHRLREELAPLTNDGNVAEGKPRLEFDSRACHVFCELTAQLAKNREIPNVLAQLVPGLSMTGFPKRSAVEIIAQHEPFVRHAYTGAMGYWAPHGRAQFNLGVRLLTMHEGLGYVHAASWLDVKTNIEETLHRTDQGMVQFFSKMHNQPIRAVHEQSLY